MFSLPRTPWRKQPGISQRSGNQLHSHSISLLTCQSACSTLRLDRSQIPHRQHQPHIGLADPLAIRMNPHFPLIRIAHGRIIETLAPVQAGDAGGMEWVLEIGGHDFFQGSRSGGGLFRAASCSRRCLSLSLAVLLHDFAFASARRPASVIRIRATSAISRPARTRSDAAVARAVFGSGGSWASKEGPAFWQGPGLAARGPKEGLDRPACPFCRRGCRNWDVMAWSFCRVSPRVLRRLVSARCDFRNEFSPSQSERILGVVLVTTLPWHYLLR